MNNQSKFTPEEVFLFGLNRLAYPARLQDLCSIYGRDFSQWSRVFSFFIEHIYHNYKHLLFNNWECWKSSIPSFSAAIRLKIMEKGGEQYDDLEHCGRFAFIDCTTIATC